MRARKSESWIEDHSAIRMKLEGHVKSGTLLPVPGPPRLGFRIYFADGHDDVLTSPVVAIVRPPKRVVDGYPKP